MSYEAVDKAIRSKAKLSLAERMILIVLSHHLNEDTKRCFPSIETIEEISGANRKTIFKVLKNLEEKGLISIEKGSRNSNSYQINLDMSSTKNGTTKIGTSTKNGTSSSTKNGTSVVPKTVHEQVIEQVIEQVNINSGAQAKKTEEKRNPISCKKVEPKTHRFNIEKMPDDWNAFCKKSRPDLNAENVFFQFKAYWTIGKGSETNRSDRGWNQTWINWVNHQTEQRNQFKTSEPVKKFTDDYYANDI